MNVRLVISFTVKRRKPRRRHKAERRLPAQRTINTIAVAVGALASAVGATIMVLQYVHLH